MEDDIAEVKTRMKGYLNELSESGVDFKMAIVDYRDFPRRTGDSDDYAYRVQCDFTNSYDKILTAINSLTLGNGGDYKETLYSALVDGLDELSWRSNAGKCAIIMGDAPALDPEPYTGYTAEMVINKLLYDRVAFGVGYLGIGAKRSAITVYAVATSYSEETRLCFKELADETDGKFYTSTDAKDTGKIIGGIIEEIPESIDAPTSGGSSFLSFFEKIWESILAILILFNLIK